MWISPGVNETVAPVLLALTVLSLWLARRAWLALFVLTILVGYANGQLTGPAWLWISLLAGACWTYVAEVPPRATRATPREITVLKAVSLVAIVGLSIGLGSHVLQGYHNIRVLPPTQLTTDAIPYEQWINFDKTSVGVLILGIYFRQRLRGPLQWENAPRQAAIPAIVTIVLVVSLSLAFGYVRWEPKWTSQFWLWAAINLLSTCLSEEAFFRGFMQSELERLFARWRDGAIVAIGCSAVLFGIAHAAGGWRYVLLATVAGAGYGTVFYRSRSIEMSILAHFTLNCVHFLLFTYPAVLPAQ